MNSLADQVRIRRGALGISQEQLALLAGCSRFFVIELEAGKTTIRLDKLQAVATVLGLQVALIDRQAR